MFSRFTNQSANTAFYSAAAFSRRDIRKQRRKRPAFAGLQRQSPLTTTKGAGAVQAAKNPVGSSTGQGDLRSRAGARLTRPQPTAGLFLALPSKSALFRCEAVLPQDFGCRKCEKGQATLSGLPAPLNIFCVKILRQNRRFLMPHRPSAAAFLRKKAPRFAAGGFEAHKIRESKITRRSWKQRRNQRCGHPHG